MFDRIPYEHLCEMYGTAARTPWSYTEHPDLRFCIKRPLLRVPGAQYIERTLHDEYCHGREYYHVNGLCSKCKCESVHLLILEESKKETLAYWDWWDSLSPWERTKKRIARRRYKRKTR